MSLCDLTVAGMCPKLVYLYLAENQRQARSFMDFEGGHARDLMLLAHRALRCDAVDKGALCTAAIGVVDNPPRDGILRSLADHVCQAVFDWACFDGSPARLEGVVRAYETAATALKALQVEDGLNSLHR
jgi:hypothetical protein